MALRRYAFALVLLLPIAWLLLQLREDRPLRIGFIGTLSGPLASLGIAARDGVLLAVEERNATGGIDDRPLELLVRDDRNDTSSIFSIDGELLNQGVVAVIGHTSSSLSLAALPLYNQRRILLVGPSNTANSLSGKDDYFVRVTPPSMRDTDLHARRAVARGLRKMTILLDASNPKYTEELATNFATAFEKRGGTILRDIAFTAGHGVDYSTLAQVAASSGAEGVFIAAGPLDAALLCQHLRRINPAIDLQICGQAFSEEFLRNGGTAVEGAFLVHSFDNDSRNPNYLDFCRRYETRFGVSADAGAVQAYDAVELLFAALAKNPDAMHLKETVLSIRTFPGLLSEIALDRFGDPERDYFPFIVEDGKFRKADPIP